MEIKLSKILSSVSKSSSFKSYKFYSKFLTLNILYNLPVNLVSSQSIISASCKASKDLILKSFKFPKGVGHTIKFPKKNLY